MFVINQKDLNQKQIDAINEENNLLFAILCSTCTKVNFTKI